MIVRDSIAFHNVAELRAPLPARPRLAPTLPPKIQYEKHPFQSTQ